MEQDRKMSEIQLAKLVLAEAKATSDRLVAEFRSKAWTQDEMTQAILGIDKGLVPWRSELLYMLSVCDGEPLATIYEAVGVTGAQVMRLRRKDDDVATAIRDYMGAYFEDEAMLPHRNVRPQVLALALTATAHGWDASSLAALTPEKMQAILRAVVDAVRNRVPDVDVQRQIGADIKAAFDRNVALRTIQSRLRS